MHPLNEQLENLAATPWDAAMLNQVLALKDLPGMLSGISVLETIRDKRLWRGNHPSFDAYLRAKSGLSELAFNNIISVRNQVRELLN